jgi:membrane protease YdiL (CAAX protease family)
MRDATEAKGDEAIWQYLCLAFALSWALWIPVILHKGNPVFLNLSGGPALAAMWLSASTHARRTNLARAFAFVALTALCWLIVVLNVGASAGPHAALRFDPWLLVPSAISAWIVSGAFSRDFGVRALLRTLVAPPDWRWCLISLLSLPALLLFSVVLGRLTGRPITNPLPGVPGRALAALIAVNFLHELFFTAVFEEAGWRGFLLPRLQLRFSPLMATTLVWLPWAVWHLPLDFTRPGGWSLLAILELRGPALLLASILITWLYNRSRGALLSPVLFHASMNSFPFLLPSITCLEINPDYIEVGKKILPEAQWVRADVFNLPSDLGKYDCAIANPPFGANPTRGASPRYAGPAFEYKVIDIASDLADYGVFLIPQASAPFEYSGMPCYLARPNNRYDRFREQTGIDLEPNCGLDTSVYQGEWKSVVPVVEIVTVDFRKARTARGEGQTNYGEQGIESRLLLPNPVGNRGVEDAPTIRCDDRGQGLLPLD